MANPNDFIANMPNIPRTNGFRRQARPQADPVAQSMKVLFEFIREMLDEQKDTQEQNTEAFDGTMTQIKALITELHTLILSNDKQLIVSEIEKIVDSIDQKIQSPSITLNQEDVVRAIQAIKLPEFKSKDLSPDFRNLAGKLDLLYQAVGEIELHSPDEVSLKNPKITAELPKESLELLKYLENLKTTAKNPLAVRLSDGKGFYKAIGKLEKGVQAVALNGGNESPSKKVVSGTKTMTGSAVQLTATSVGIRWITVSAVGQPCAVGDSSVVADLATPANSIGDIIYPGNAPTKIRISDPSLLYADGASGAAVAFNYYL